MAEQDIPAEAVEAAGEYEVIPAEAIDAAAKALYFYLDEDHRGAPAPWESLAEDDEDKISAKETARLALEAAAPHMLAEVTALVAALTDPDDCSFDHHGGCQAHGYLDLKIGEMCPQLEAKAWAHNHRPTP